MQKSLHIEADSKEVITSQLPEWLNTGNSAKKIDKWVVNWADVGATVRAKRIASGMSLRSAAKWLNISAPYLSSLERGHLPWSLQRLQAVADILSLANRTKKSKSHEQK